jgi:hypothetical protein
MRFLPAGPDFEENLSIRYLASSLPADGQETLLAVFHSADDVEAAAEQAGEAVVGLSLCRTYLINRLPSAGLLSA